MDKMGLIVFAATGHVLGAFTRQGDPEKALDPEVVAGEGVWVRDEVTGERRVAVPPRDLGVLTVDREDRVLLDWRSYRVVDGMPDNMAEEVTDVQYSAAGLQLQLSLSTNTTEEVTAWIQIEALPGGERTLEDVVIPSGMGAASPFTVPLPLATGVHGVLVLVPGYRPRSARIIV